MFVCKALSCFLPFFSFVLRFCVWEGGGRGTTFYSTGKVKGMPVSSRGSFILCFFFLGEQSYY